MSTEGGPVTAPTPGQAAYEARMEAVWGTDWALAEPAYIDLSEPDKASWEDTARLIAASTFTALKAVPGDTVILAFGRPLEQEDARRIRERFAAVAPGVNLAVVDSSAEAAIAAAAPAGTTGARSWTDTLPDRHINEPVTMLGCWCTVCAEIRAEQPQPAPEPDAAPPLGTAWRLLNETRDKLTATTALLGTATALLWDTHLASLQKQANELRAEGGLGVLR